MEEQQQQQQPINENSNNTAITTTTTGINTNNCTVSTSSPNVVTIPVPVVSPPEDIYTYVAIKGSLHAQDCSIFGLNKEEILALSKRFASGSTEIINGIMVKAAPIDVINTISKLGYKVISSTGEAETVWTMQREI